MAQVIWPALSKIRIIVHLTWYSRYVDAANEKRRESRQGEKFDTIGTIARCAIPHTPSQ